MKNTSEVYPHLYHYTTWTGLLGILDKQSIWATHYKFLNDYSEIILFKDKLIEFLLPHTSSVYRKLMTKYANAAEIVARQGGFAKVIHYDTEVLVSAQYQAAAKEIYIASFCGAHKEPYINENGLLSQWRGYGTDGGFAVVFNAQALEELLQTEAERYSYSFGSVADLIYSDDDAKFQEELSSSLQDVASHITSMLDCLDRGVEDVMHANEGYHGFLSCITRYKHCGFKEENEVRVIAVPEIQNEELKTLAKEAGETLKPDKERKFRLRQNERIPYIELFGAPDFTLPIERIIVGPHKEKAGRAEALRVMLRHTPIDVTISDIPYAT